MKKLLLCFIVQLLVGIHPILAQIGVNNTSPDSNAVLDIKANSKGLLIPRMTTVQREAMSSGAGFSQGMMVYDTNLDILFVGYGNGATGNTEWYAMNPWKTEYRTDNNADTAHMTTMTASGIKHGKVGIGVASPVEKLDVNGWTKSTGFIGYGITPIGGVIMWSGADTSIPDGWALCDGNNGTPDLRERFVVGAGGNNSSVVGGAYNPHAIGGANLVTLTVNQIPSHRHALTDADITLWGGGHTHAIETSDGLNGKDYYGHESGDNTNNHDNTFYTNFGGAHDHGISGVTAYSGSGHSHENRPPYFALAYIMRTK